MLSSLISSEKYKYKNKYIKRNQCKERVPCERTDPTQPLENKTNLASDKTFGFLYKENCFMSFNRFLV